MARNPVDIRSLCRAYTEETVRIVAGIVRAVETPPATRIAGAAMLWERGWGKAPQTHTGEEDIRITIRHIIEGNGAERVDTKQIDAVSIKTVSDDTGGQ